MLIAPHPDDEVLACGIALQYALERGAEVRVVYVTDGDNNPWPQRVAERKWRISAEDRQRWGKLRQAEGLAALHVLGVAHDQVEFLGYPDQSLTSLLLTNRDCLLLRLSRVIAEWSPTDILVPALCDRHPDHSAVAVFLRLLARSRLPDPESIAAWSYIVHGGALNGGGSALALRGTATQTARKIEAIRCHATQMKLSRRRFLAYAERAESFVRDYFAA